MFGTFSKVYELQLTNKYQDTDIVINYDEYSEARLINKRDLIEEYGEYFDYVLPFFNLYVLAESNDDIYYANMFAGMDYEFEQLIDKDVYLSSNEVIISHSYANQYNIDIGDQITFYILDYEFNYFVADIFQDEGVFSDVSFFVEKESVLERIYNLSTLNNFGNTIYLNVKDSYNIDDVLSVLSEDTTYQMYHVFPTVDWDYISNRALDLSSMMLALGLIVLLAMIMVLDSLFPIINKDIRQHLGVINTLGGSPRMIYHIKSMQWVIYTAISFLLGTIISIIVTNIGVKVYGLNGFVPVDVVALLLSLVIVILFVEGRTYLSFKKESEFSVASQSKNKRYLSYKLRYPLLLLSLIIFIVEYYFVFFGVKYHSLILVATSIYFVFEFSSILLIWLSKLISLFKRKTIFKIFQIKYLKENKHIHQSLRVLSISLISLVMIFSVRGFMYSQIDDFTRIIKFDLAVTNIGDYSEGLKNDFTQYDVEMLDEAVFYQNIVVHYTEDSFEPVRYFISMDQVRMSNYFDFTTSAFDASYINGDTPYILVSKNLQLVYDLEIGQMLKMDINYKIKDIDVVIAGFLDIQMDNFVYSNIYTIEEYQDDIQINTLFINSEDSNELFNQIVKDYGNRMYFVINSSIYFDSMINDVENVTDYFTVFTSFMIICFMIVIFNNTLLVFYDLKTDLSKVKVLGFSNKMMIINLLKEFIILFIVISLVGVLEITILSKYLKYLVLFTNYYKDISASVSSTVYGLVISTLVLLISYLYYFFKYTKLKVVEEIKIY
jgi:predicted lysophospholipase L1 biosynthesis ABC-type transport system permease subunit